QNTNLNNRTQSFVDALGADFRQMTMTALDLQDIQVAPDHRSVTFQEVESVEYVEDTGELVQQTRLWRTTFHLVRTETGGVVTFRISAVRRVGPLVKVTTPGQVQAGVSTRIKVQGSGGPFVLARVQV